MLANNIKGDVANVMKN